MRRTSRVGSETSAVLLVEDKFAGHWLHYVRYIVDAVPEHRRIVLLTSERVLASKEFAQLRLAEAVSTRALEHDQLRWADIKASAAVEGVGTIIVPAADRFLLAALLSGRPKSAAVTFLVMRSLPQPQLSRIRRFVFRLVKSFCIKVLRIRGFRVLSLVSALATPERSRTVADPTRVIRSDGESGLSREVEWFAVVGHITERKNLPVVAEAVSLAAKKRRDIGLVVAGQCSSRAVEQLEHIREEFNSSGLPLVVMNQPLTDSLLDAVVADARAVVVAHGNEGPSGIVAKAIALGTPVVAAGAHSLREDAVRRPDAVLWSPLGPTELKANIIKVFHLQFAPTETNATPRAFALELLGMLQ